jgi:hypothetical protein
VAYSWRTSTLSQGSGVELERYNVTLIPVGGPESDIVSVVVTEAESDGTFGTGQTGLEQVMHTVSVVAVFSNPALVSEPLNFTFTPPTEAEGQQ